MLAKRFRVTVGQSRFPRERRSQALHGYHYPICTLLPNLGFSYQKGRFVSEHLKHFPECTLLPAEVDKALLHFAHTLHEIIALMTRSCDSLGALAA